MKVGRIISSICPCLLDVYIEVASSHGLQLVSTVDRQQCRNMVNHARARRICIDDRQGVAKVTAVSNTTLVQDTNLCIGLLDDWLCNRLYGIFRLAVCNCGLASVTATRSARTEKSFLLDFSKCISFGCHIMATISNTFFVFILNKVLLLSKLVLQMSESSLDVVIVLIKQRW